MGTRTNMEHEDPAWSRRVRSRPADVFAAALVCGAAPLGRIAAVNTGFGVLVVVAALLGIGVLVAAMYRADPLRQLFLGGWVLLLTAFIGAVALLTSNALNDPSLLASSLMFLWVAGGALLASWTVGGVRMPLIGTFDRRGLPLVLGTSAYAGLAAATGDALVADLVLWLTCATAALVASLFADRVDSAWVWLVGVAGRRCVTTDPVLRLASWAGLLWWASNVRMVAAGLLRGADGPYAAWRLSLRSTQQWVEVVFGIAGLGAALAGVLTVGVLVTLKGASVMGRIAWWLGASTLVGIAAAVLVEPFA